MFYASTQQAETFCNDNCNNKNVLDDFEPVQTDLSQKVRYVSVSPSSFSTTTRLNRSMAHGPDG